MEVFLCLVFFFVFILGPACEQGFAWLQTGQWSDSVGRPFVMNAMLNSLKRSDRFGQLSPIEVTDFLRFQPLSSISVITGSDDYHHHPRVLVTYRDQVIKVICYSFMIKNRT
jgi:hypothetical protein